MATVPVWMIPSGMLSWFNASVALRPVNQMEGNIVLLETEYANPMSPAAFMAILPIQRDFPSPGA